MKTTLNLGCGERTYIEYPPGYECLNFDERADLPNVDVVGDVRNLPSTIPDEHFDYILASDIIEHFPIADIPAVLAGWRRVLKKDGVIEFRLPNLEAICEDYVKRKNENRSTPGKEPIAHYFSWLLYGGQDYSGNFHYVGFDRRLFKHVVEKSGFVETDWQKDGYNMIVKCRRQDD